MVETKDLLNFDSKGYKLSTARTGARFLIDLESGTYAFDNEYGISQFPFDAEGSVQDVLDVCDDQTKEIYEIVTSTHRYMQEHYELSTKTVFAFDTLIRVKTTDDAYAPLIMSLDYEYDDESKSFVSVYGAIHDWNSVVPDDPEECILVRFSRNAEAVA